MGGPGGGGGGHGRMKSQFGKVCRPGASGPTDAPSWAATPPPPAPPPSPCTSPLFIRFVIFPSRHLSFPLARCGNCGSKAEGVRAGPPRPLQKILDTYLKHLFLDTTTTETFLRPRYQSLQVKIRRTAHKHNFKLQPSAALPAISARQLLQKVFSARRQRPRGMGASQARRDYSTCYPPSRGVTPRIQRRGRFQRVGPTASRQSYSCGSTSPPCPA